TLNRPFKLTTIANFILVADGLNGRVAVYKMNETFKNVVAAGNPRQVAGALDSLQAKQTLSSTIANPDFGNVLVNLFELSSKGDLTNALDQLHAAPQQDLSWLSASNYNVLYQFLANELSVRRFIAPRSVNDTAIAFASSIPTSHVHKFCQVAADTPHSFAQI